MHKNYILKFPPEDADYLLAQGVSAEIADAQINLLKTGPKFVRLDRTAAIGDGILSFNAAEKNDLARFFESRSKDKKIAKFVPASGASTRMFGDVWDFYRNGRENSHTQKFFGNIRKFVFFQDLEKYVNYGNDKRVFTKFLLTEAGLNYGNLPKALLKFYRENEVSFTPFEMHVYESIDYLNSPHNQADIYFSINTTFEREYKKLALKIAGDIEDKYGIQLNIHLDNQDRSTQTVALDEMGKLYRENNGQILLRPGGHGSLLKNISEIDSDLMYVRNIDNVLPPKHNTLNVFYEKVLGGFLIKITDKLYSILERLQNNDESAIQEAILFTETFLNTQIPSAIRVSNNCQEIYQVLNRPVRVCGVIKNTGEPGGGIYWTKDKKGNQSIQIVESAQVSKEDDQLNVFSQGFFFNPVDMVCSTKNHKGEKFNLDEFSDKSQSIITEKIHQSKRITVLEHPGLWNGGMAHWHSVFVELPLKSFNPVKNVLDLLRLTTK